MTIEELQAKIKSMSENFTNEHIVKPTIEDYLLVHNAMLKGWELGLLQAVETLQKTGTKA